MKRYDLSEVEVEKEDSRVLLRRNTPLSAALQLPPAPAPLVDAGASSTAAPPSLSVAPTDLEEPGIKYIKSPMVGTFYRAPGPEDAPFIEIGTKVSAKTEVCIIEAMKIMNRIESGISGEVVEILAENGEPVEYGRPLLKVKTS